MPTNFPPNVLAVHAARSTGKGVLWILRAMLVAAAWLAMLPYAVLWVFRFLLFTADSIGVVTLLVTRGMPASDKTSVVSRRLALALERVNAAARSKPLHELKEGLLANVTIISANWTSAEKQSLSDRVAEVLWTAEHALTCGDVASLNQTPNPMGNLTTLAAITKAGLNQTPKSVWARAIEYANRTSQCLRCQSSYILSPPQLDITRCLSRTDPDLGGRSRLCDLLPVTRVDRYECTGTGRCRPCKERRCSSSSTARSARDCERYRSFDGEGEEPG